MKELDLSGETPVAYLVFEHAGLKAVHHGVFLTETEAEQCLLRLAGGDLADRRSLYTQALPFGVVLAPEQHAGWPVRGWADVAAKYRATEES